MKKNVSKKNFYILVSLFVLGLFAYITYQTPLAGDDWGYALNGSLGTPIKTTLEFYYSWSGRIFSELWGMLIPCRKYLWNIINPLLFFLIYIFLYKLGGIKNRPILCSLFILSFMLSVDDNLRMETYTWIMGTTYVIPLLFSLVYFLIAEKLVFNNLYSQKLKMLFYLSNILLFVIGLMMENIAATMVGSIAILFIYCFFNKKQALKYLIINFIFSTLSFTIMRTSPGSASRLNSEHAQWTKMSLIEKISKSYPNFLQMTFISNNYAILLFSIALLCTVVFNKNLKKRAKVLLMIVPIVGTITVFSFVAGNNVLNDCNSIYSFIFWPIYVINAFTILYIAILDKNASLKAIFFLIVAGANAIVMLYSPIYGSRSALYTIYYLIVVGLILIDNAHISNKYVIVIFALMLLAIIGDRSTEYISKYKLVGIRNEERMEVIKYYQEHPEDEEVWIPRFSIYSIHGADVEAGDTYHFETFKEYYKLPQDSDKIVFYFVEDN